MSANFQKIREQLAGMANQGRSARPAPDMSGVAQTRSAPGRAATMLSGGTGTSAPTTATNKLLGR